MSAEPAQSAPRRGLSFTKYRSGDVINGWVLRRHRPDRYRNYWDVTCGRCGVSQEARPVDLWRRICVACKNRVTHADLERIRIAVCDRFKISEAEILGISRVRKLARPRQIALSLSRELTEHSSTDIGRHFHRDHTTVLYAFREIERLRKIRPKLDAHYRELRALVLYEPANDVQAAE